MTDIIPAHLCDGELIEREHRRAYLQVAWCSTCGTEFTYGPDCDWVTVVLPGIAMRNIRVSQSFKEKPPTGQEEFNWWNTSWKSRYVVAMTLAKLDAQRAILNLLGPNGAAASQKGAIIN